MKYDHLIHMMETDADEKIQAIRDQADSECTELIQIAQKESEQFKKQVLLETEKKSEIERARRLYEVREHARQEVAHDKEVAFQEVFSRVESRLPAVRSSPGYEASFHALVQEVVSELGESRTVLSVDPADTDLCSRLIPALGKECEVRGDISSSGGLIGSSTDGKVTVVNTMEERLRNAKQRMRREVFSILYRDPDVR